MRRLLSFNLLRVLLVVVLAAGLPVTSGAADYIKQIMLIGGSQSEVTGRMSSLKEEGWTLIDVDLNKGCGSGSDYIYLLYQSESTANNFDWGGYVTDFYISEYGYIGNVSPLYYGVSLLLCCYLVCYWPIHLFCEVCSLRRLLALY